MTLDSATIRRQFPILSADPALVYLDNAATTQKPRAMIDAMTRYYERDNANPHRGIYPLAERATAAYEDARATVSRFIGAKHPREVIFTKSSTEGINLVAKSWGRTLGEGDTIVLTTMEHHSNIVPWLQLKEERGIAVEWIETDAEGNADLDALDRLLATGRVKLVSVTALSNVLGTRPPLKEIVRRAHAASSLVLADAAQHVAHHRTDVAEWDVDFLVFSGHKLYGPTGIGVLYGKASLLDAMPPDIGGGMMIDVVTREHFTATDIPARFEGGTPPVAEAVGLRAAIDWIEQWNWKDIETHEHALIALAMEKLSAIPHVHVLGPRKATHRSGSVSFTVDGMHPHDVSHALGQRNVCVRAGHHCTQPLHRHLDVVASTRLSVALYNTTEDIEMFASSLRDILTHFLRP